VTRAVDYDQGTTPTT